MFNHQCKNLHAPFLLQIYVPTSAKYVDANALIKEP